MNNPVEELRGIKCFTLTPVASRHPLSPPGLTEGAKEGKNVHYRFPCAYSPPSLDRLLRNAEEKREKE